jgi:ABC-type transport system involved in cytochrome c biogenesis ATPase subunit
MGAAPHERSPEGTRPLNHARTDALVTLVREHAAAGGAAMLASHDAVLLEALDARVCSLG